MKLTRQNLFTPLSMGSARCLAARAMWFQRSLASAGHE
jgi:hypothetical protein